MAKNESQTESARAEFEALDKEFQAYIGRLKTEWLASNRSRSKDVYEVMRPQERTEVHHCIDRWGKYVTPFAEAWWKVRGYEVVWPDDNSKPMQVRKLDAA